MLGAWLAWAEASTYARNADGECSHIQAVRLVLRDR